MRYFGANIYEWLINICVCLYFPELGKYVNSHYWEGRRTISSCHVFEISLFTSSHRKVAKNPYKSPLQISFVSNCIFLISSEQELTFQTSGERKTRQFCVCIEIQDTIWENVSIFSEVGRILNIMQKFISTFW